MSAILSTILFLLMLAAFGFGLYKSIKKSRNGGCSGCSGCPAANNCSKKQNN